MSNRIASVATAGALSALLDFYDDDPKRWTKKRYYARRSPNTGRALPVSWPEEADCFCLIGRIYYSDSIPSAQQRLVVCALLKAAGLGRSPARIGWNEGAALVRWNDERHRTFPQVKALLQRALKETLSRCPSNPAAPAPLA